MVPLLRASALSPGNRSKDPEGPALRFTPEDWRRFTARIRG